LKNLFSKNFALITIVLITVLIFWQFFVKGLLPFPGDFMLAWFEPWKSSYSENGVITLQHKPIADDIFRQLFPFKSLAMHMVKNGELPLWNPYNGSGQPLLATMHVGLLNPFNILFFLTDDKTAWSLQVILSVLGIGLSMYIFARKIGCKQAGSLFTAITYMFSGFVIVRSIYNDYNYAVLCLPLLLYVIEDLWNGKSKKVFFIPFLLFFLTTVVQPQIIFYILSFTGLYLIVRQIFSKQKLSRRNILLLIFLLSIGFLLSCLQLLPTLELYHEANVTTASSQFIIQRFLLPISHFVTIIIPNYFGNQATYNYWGSGDYIETITSLGTIPIFFAILGIFASKKLQKSIKIFAVFSIVLAILSTVKFFGTELFYSLPIPIISTGIPSRILFIIPFCLAISAGFGYEAWLEEKNISKLGKAALATFITLLLGILIVTAILFIKKTPCNNIVILNCWNIALRNTLLETGVFLLFIVFFLGARYSNKQKILTTFQIAVFTIITTVGFYNSQKFLPFSKKEHIMPEHTILSELRSKENDGRVFGYDKYAVKTDLATYYRFFDTNYYDPLYIKRYGDLIQYANDGNLLKQLPRSDVEIDNAITLPYEKTFRRERLFQILGVNKIISPKKENIQEKKKVISGKRVYMVSKTYVTRRKEENLTQLFTKDFDPSSEITVEKNILVKGDSNGTAKIIKETENTVNIKTTANGEKILVLADNYFPGWKAYIDGKETEVFRANFTFRGVRIPAGVHSVVFSYEPNSLRLGAYLSISGLIFFLLLFILWPKIGSKKHK
jgi:hypothetical protein